jgi:hypothetical protein
VITGASLQPAAADPESQLFYLAFKNADLPDHELLY